MNLIFYNLYLFLKMAQPPFSLDGSSYNIFRYCQSTEMTYNGLGTFIGYCRPYNRPWTQLYRIELVLSPEDSNMGEKGKSGSETITLDYLVKAMVELGREGLKFEVMKWGTIGSIFYEYFRNWLPKRSIAISEIANIKGNQSSELMEMILQASRTK